MTAHGKSPIGKFVTYCDCQLFLRRFAHWTLHFSCDHAHGPAFVTPHVLKSSRKRLFYGSFLDH
jgi:hypothetical protein